MKPLDESPFSEHFNRLVWIGGWLPETMDQRQKHFFFVYESCFSLTFLLGCCLLFWDLCVVLGDFKKMAWNLCVSILFTGSFTKMLQLVYQKELINDLRLKLHRRAEAKGSVEYTSIHDKALKELRFLKMTLYGSATIFIPIWLLTRYFSCARELPIPLHLPFPVDLEDKKQYTLAFFLTGAAGIFGIVFGMEVEMAMFSIFIQLSREYEILMKDIPNLNLLYAKSNLKETPEINPFLRRSKARMIIKNLCIHQKEIFECARVFEHCYNQVFLQQFLGVSILIILIGLQCMLETVDVFGSFSYQMGYLCVLSINSFMICWFSTRLKLLCFQVGETAYSTHWYKMERDICRSLVMIIRRSQNPPKLTIGKLVEVNLNAFLNSIGNICSWLVLLRQFQVNTSPKNSH